MKKLLPFIYIPLFIALLFHFLFFYTPLETPIYLFDAKFYDYFVSSKANELEASNNTIEDIVIIDIDNYSINPERLGKFSSWDLGVHAKLIKQIAADSPKCIAFDIIFDPSKDKRMNDSLIQAVQNAGVVINAMSFVSSKEEQFDQPDLTFPDNYNYNKDIVNLPINITTTGNIYEKMDAPWVDLFNASRANGSVVFVPDADAIIRKVQPFIYFLDHNFPFFALQMFMQSNQVTNLNLTEDRDSLKLFTEENRHVRSIPMDKNGLVNITYVGSSLQRFRLIPYYSVLNYDENFDRKEHFFKDKYVIVGTTLAGLFDLRSTPVSPVYPGVGIHANLLNTLIENNFISRLNIWQLTLFMFIIGIITSLLVHYFTLLKSVFTIIFLLLLNIVLSQLIYENYSLYVQQFPIVLSSVFTIIGTYAYKYNTEEKSKRMIKSAFSQFVNKKVVDDLLADPTKLKLGGEKKVCSVFFSDVAGFTTISEQLDAEQLVKLLNAYLTDMTNIIFENDGMIDKYIGDAIMAVYGAPISTGNHAYQACKGAIRQLQRLKVLRQELMEQGYPSLLARMGINTGPMVVGNMGSHEYFNYTVMGDSVNLAARLEPANKDYDTLCMIGFNTYEMAKEFIHARQLDLMVVKGKTEPVAVFELYGLKEDPINDDELKMLDFYNYGYQHYLSKNFKEALKSFQEATKIKSDDGPSLTYIARCEEYIKNPPDESWTGVYVKKSK